MKILIRLPNWLGDMVMSTAFIGAVQRVYPGAQIDVIVKKERDCRINRWLAYDSCLF
jgi:ADP-heptose:LPS heptosyltransferase